MELGGAEERNRYPRLTEVIPGRAPGERYYRFRGGLLIRRSDRLVEVVATAGRATGAFAEGGTHPLPELNGDPMTGPPRSIQPLPAVGGETG